MLIATGVRSWRSCFISKSASLEAGVPLYKKPAQKGIPQGAELIGAYEEVTVTGGLWLSSQKKTIENSRV